MTTDFGSIGTAAAMVFIGFMTVWNNRQNKKAAVVIEKVHILANSAMSAQLKLNVEFAEANSVQAHRIAEITKEEGDMAAATASDVKVKSQQTLYQEHQMQQAKVDAKSQ